MYDGFISYSHAADDLLAPRLQAGLQRFAKPWWKRRAVRIFRDESSLSANPHLWSSITEALDTSGWFVLLLSPDASSSEWVNQEIAYWVEHRDPKKILPVVTDGTFGWADDVMTGSAVPGALQGVFSEEPRWVDLRFARHEEQLDLQHPEFNSAIADIASTIRGIPKDDLASEEVRQHRRTIRTAWIGAIALVTLAVLALIGQQQARNQADFAQGTALLASARTLIEEDVDLALLLSLEAAALLGRSGDVEEVLHTLLLAGTARTTLPVSADAPTRSYAVAIRPGTGDIAVTPSGNQVTLFDPVSLEPLKTLGESNDVSSSSVPSIAFDTNGDRVATIDTLGVVRVWDIESGILDKEFDTGEGDTGAILFADGDRLLITSIHTRTAWDLETQQPVWQNDDPVQSFGGAPISIDRSDGLVAWPSILLSQVTSVDIRTGEVMWQIPLPGAIGVDFHPRLDVVMVKSQFLGIQMLDYSDREPISIYQLESAAPTDVAFSPDGSRFVDRAGPSFATVYEAVDPTDPAVGWGDVGTFYQGADLALSFAFLPDDRMVAGLPSGAAVWSLQPEGEVARLRTPPTITIEAVPDSDLVWTAHSPDLGMNELNLWDMSTGSRVLSSSAPIEPGDFVTISVVSADLGLAVLPGGPGLAVIDPSNGDVRLSLESPPGDQPEPFRFAASIDGSVIAGVPDGTSEVVVWDGSTGQIEQIRSFNELGFVQGLAIDRAGAMLAAGGDNGVALLDLTAPDSMPVRLQGDGNTHGLDFSPDGSLLATAVDTFGLMNAYDLASGERLASVRVPGAFDPDFSEDGTQLVLAGAQSGVITFDTDTWERRWTIGMEHLSGAVAILSADVAGDRVVFAGTTGLVYEITLDYERLLAIARNRVARSLTIAECEEYRIDPCPTLEEVRDG